MVFDPVKMIDGLNHPAGMLIPNRVEVTDGPITVEEVSYPDEVGAVTFHVNLEAAKPLNWYLKKIHRPIFDFVLAKLPETTNVNSEIVCLDGVNSVCIRVTGLEKTPAYQSSALCKLIMEYIKEKNIVVKCAACGHVGYDSYGHCVECGAQIINDLNPHIPRTPQPA